MAWLLLLIAGLLEVVWALALSRSEGFTRLWPSLLFLVAGTISVGVLALALRSLPVGPAYAIWTGIGAVGTAIAGVILLGEAADVARFVGVGLILAGILVLGLVAEI